MAQFNVTELDFDKIKDSIKDHFRSQSKYNSWDFDGSGLSLLLDILAYNTHYNAMVAHLSLNETFLDSAQIRGNVVSHAKLLGYVPRSFASSKAIISFTVNAGVNPPAYITLSRGTRFSTTLDQTSYSFVVLEPVQAPLLNGAYTFTNIEVTQGTLKRMLYRVDNSLENQKFKITDENIDTNTMRVRVKANEESEEYAIYTKFTTLVGIDDASQIYYLQEDSIGTYEIYFGDGVLGKKPISNNIVEIEYVYTTGKTANGATSFTASDTVSGYNVASVTTVTASYGGAVRETIESIRYNAPLTFIAQNRAVTADDYRALILKSVGYIESIAVWGGEDQEAPDYGKVYIAIKPNGADYLTADQKSYITGTVLKGKNVVSITPVIVDPQYTYLTLDVYFKYNPNLTDRTKIELQALIRDTISNYNDNNLKKFDGVFRFSQFLRDIDKSDPSILNSTARVFMYKDITPNPAISNSFVLEYSSPIYQTSSTEDIIESSAFLINGVEHYFGDTPIVGTNNRTVYIYKLVNGNRVKIKDTGIIEPAVGKVTLSGFRPDNDTSIRITVIPNSNDLAPKRNQLLEINLLSTSVIGEIDTIAVAGSAGAINYTTTARHR
jgi:hypothetical protein